MTTTTTTPTVSLVDELVAIIAKIGGAVTVSECEYQLRRRGHTLTGPDVVDALCQAEAEGLLTPYAWTLGIAAKDQPTNR
jgi:hypothetical protein